MDATDLDLTLVLIDATEAAVRGGLSVMVDLDPAAESRELYAAGLSATAGGSAPSAGGSVALLGPGCVRVRTVESIWTIDLSRGRMFRSDSAIDPFFVTPEAWTSVRAIWLSCASVMALTADGSYLSARSAWRATCSNRLRSAAVPADDIRATKSELTQMARNSIRRIDRVNCDLDERPQHTPFGAGGTPTRSPRVHAERGEPDIARVRD